LQERREVLSRRFHVFAFLFYAVLVCGLSPTALSASGSESRAANTASAPAWEVSGIFAEACECNPPCPCWQGRLPTQHHCHNVQIYKIERGRYGAVRLDNLVVVVEWVSPEGRVMDKSADQSVLVAIYLDRSTSPGQREALEKIWKRSFLRGVKGSKGGMKAVRFEKADVEPGRAVVIIRHILAFDVRRGSAQEMDVQDLYVHDMQLARSARYRYSDYGMAWDYPGKHAAFGTFHAQSSRN